MPTLHGPCLIWTRSLEDWSSDAKHLDRFLRANDRLLHLPCIRVCPLTLPSLTGPFDEIVFTSANAVRIVMGSSHMLTHVRKAKRVWTHGEKTAAALTSSGVAVTQPAAKTSEELAQILAAKCAARATVLVATAKEPAYDVAGHLAAAGLAVTPVLCYATTAELTDNQGRAVSPHQCARWQTDLTGTVAFASPSAVQAFCTALVPRGGALGDRLKVAAIGGTTAAAAQPFFSHVVTANVQTVESLVECAVALLPR